MPVANTYAYALEHVDLTKLGEALRSWMQAHDIAWQGDIIAVDGKVLIGASRTGHGRATASAFSVTRSDAPAPSQEPRLDGGHPQRGRLP